MTTSADKHNCIGLQKPNLFSEFHCTYLSLQT